MTLFPASGANETLTVIGVIGAGSCDSATGEIARSVGALIAERGAALVCGGLGGVMEAAARGAREKGGLTIGVTPGDSRDDVNPYIDIPVVTGMGHARNVIVVHTAQALIAVSGGSGTLSEIAIALKTGKPVVAIGKWGSVEGVVCAEAPVDAVEKAFELI